MSKTPGDRWPEWERRAWRYAQIAVWLLGVGIVVALLVSPRVGIHALWNILIPVAPALLAMAPGLWRNICPLASTSLAARHLGLGLQYRPSSYSQQGFRLLGVALLVALVPLRHVLFDTSGPASAAVLLALASASLMVGLVFDWKSGWCSGICPVHPVERLYGGAPAISPANAHCHECVGCVAICPDSTPAVTPLTGSVGWLGQFAGTLLVGGFPGFVWGWFQVPDHLWPEGWSHLGEAYAWPAGGAAVTLLTYLLLRLLVPGGQDRFTSAFAGVAIAGYYWYRLPALVGFGPFPGDGMLLDLRGVLPEGFPALSRVVTTGFFAWWFLGKRVPVAWTIRPESKTPPAAGGVLGSRS